MANKRQNDVQLFLSFAFQIIKDFEELLYPVLRLQ